MDDFGFKKEENKDYILNFYRYKFFKTLKSGSKIYLITLDHGEFLFLNSSALNQLKKGKILYEKLYETLLEKSIILNEKNTKTTIKKTARRYAFLENSLSLHIVIPTFRCNQGCNYCFASPQKVTANKSKFDMSETTAIKTIEFIMKSKSHAITIEFTGGEALLRFDLVKLMILHAKKLNKTAKKDLRITIVTNLTIMSENILNWLINNRVSICTSLDGPQKVHNANRFILSKTGKNLGSYDLVTNWIEKTNKLYKEKNMPNKIGALMTISKQSLNFPKEIINEYVNWGFEIIDLRGMMKVGRAEEKNDENQVHYTFEEFVKFYEIALNHIKNLKEKGIKISDRAKSLYETKILENTPTYHSDYESPWGSGTATVTYFTNGDIYSCHEALGREEFKLGSVLKDTPKEIFERKESSFSILSSTLESNPICDRCVYKPYCGTLPIENFYSQGKFNFYPQKTQRHFETIFYSNLILEEEFKKLKLE